MRKKIIMYMLLILTLVVMTTTSVFAQSSRHTNQDVTAYVAPAGSKTYHGSTPTQYNTVAVHPETFGDPESGTIFPYGTTIVTDTELVLVDEGGSQWTNDTFHVEDMGDVDNDQGLTLYWFDIYFGDTVSDYNDAIYFGKKKVSYTAYY